MADAARREAVVLEVSAYRMTVRRADRADADFIYGANRFFNSVSQGIPETGLALLGFPGNPFRMTEAGF